MPIGWGPVLGLPGLPRGPEVVLPALERAALLLDLDGTLLDIAPRPDAVVVPPGLADALLEWRGRLGGALAIVTGRPIDQVDALLPDVPMAVAGEHGAAVRHRPDGPIERPFLPALPEGWMAAAGALRDAHPGSLLEEKSRGFVLHYRLAPQAGAAIGEALAALLAAGPDEAFALLPAHMAWEVRPRGTDKGRAVARLMGRPPFAGRLPVFIGDDVTDDDGVAEARLRGGVGLKVDVFFGSAAAVRAWLA